MHVGKGAGLMSHMTSTNQVPPGAVEPAVSSSGLPTGAGGGGGRSLDHCSVPLTESSFRSLSPAPSCPEDVVQLCCSIPVVNEFTHLLRQL